MTAADSPLAGVRTVLGVGGGIAAYKAAHVVRGLVASGAEVRVIPTPASLAFVGAATWEALSHHEVLTSVFEHVDEVAHVRVGQDAELVVIAPATADLLARLRLGRADDMLTATALMARCPVVVVPAMHTEMWQHPATVENVAVLRSRGVTVLEPDSGRLTGPDSGPGRLPEPDAILGAALAAVTAPRTPAGAPVRDLEGVRVLVTAGGTHEQIDPVRFIANHSSGRQGLALAQAALVRGADVTLVAANVDLPSPPGARRLDVGSAAELAEAVAAERTRADVLVMAAAVADFAPASRAAAKIKKTGEDDVPVLELVRTEDILRTSVGARRDDPATAPGVIVGFAAETGDEATAPIEHARAKARAKGADLLVFNDVSAGVFGAAANDVTVLDASGEVVRSAAGDKSVVSHAVLDEVVRRRGHVR
ncbi:bifunctional phosphopantothenoylcysteine decarboxylase/phosphopantothenate--cysteine ligase CoaBC [Brachybacterium huguangmaarense]|uniref:Coenzyme A biosynthesis bifunctional protein CoaBC n=1 Tax=Brachybacterium huguangmaarense TaxID=1652028 RepID=A0ABY6G033_9MICO|nr:bifunctional phosphopantothenoylcysteine decarboxylase/phosphopantothenate--cysteine ligase CoaBC [Brachybacterium huguangmaarense]UYG16440.1 bifunctional phosphopantothenoylcysteine decarboxylase/phosphopantothenate--cysteine ligase CoaBC [Brachybacterium huguangmaarense]